MNLIPLSVQKLASDTVDQDERLGREAIKQRTDPRFELIVYVTPGTEREVRERLEAFASELIGLTGDVVVIQPDELATVQLLRR